MSALRAATGWLAALLFCFSLSTQAAQVPVPPLTARAMDQTGTLTAEQIGALEQKLRAFEAQKGSQIAVLIVPTTGDDTIEQYSIRVVEAWKLGRKGVDDGALLLVAKNDRTLRIEVGYGLEGVLNDATAKRITSEIIVPAFKRGDFYGGISAGVDKMIQVINGEALPPPKQAPQRAERGGDLGSLAPMLLILVFFVGGVLRSMFGRPLGAMLAGGGAAMLSWIFIGTLWMAVLIGLAAFLFTLLTGFGGGGGWGGGWGGGGWGGGGWGGGSGGGSSDDSGGVSGGGGGFGGGGSSDRW
jgi:uncharacterized protein